MKWYVAQRPRLLKQDNAHFKQQEHDEGTDGKAGNEEFKQEVMMRGKKSQTQIKNLFTANTQHTGQYQYRCFHTDVANLCLYLTPFTVK